MGQSNSKYNFFKDAPKIADKEAEQETQIPEETPSSEKPNLVLVNLKKLVRNRLFDDQAKALESQLDAIFKELDTVLNRPEFRGIVDYFNSNLCLQPYLPLVTELMGWNLLIRASANINTALTDHDVQQSAASFFHSAKTDYILQKTIGLWENSKQDPSGTTGMLITSAGKYVHDLGTNLGLPPNTGDSEHIFKNICNITLLDLKSISETVCLTEEPDFTIGGS